MDHSEALQQMAAERFLLDELTPEEREDFEAHVFDCPECALDLRAGAAFVDEAKIQLPQLIAETPTPERAEAKTPKKDTFRWQLWWRPAFTGLAFTSMLLLGYQNLLVYPALRVAANQPHLLPWASLHANTRGAQSTLTADRKTGVALPVDLSGPLTSASYASYSVDLVDPQGKLAWTGTVSAPAEGDSANQSYSLVIPGAALRDGQYIITVSGIAANGQRNPVNRYVFDIHMAD